MSHWSQLEKQLRSWTPRAPSPSLKARLFPEAAIETGAADADGQSEMFALGPAVWHWLAPAMAVFVLGLFVVGQHPAGLEHFNAETSPNFLATVAWSRAELAPSVELAPYYASVRHSDNNALRSTFEWTNGGGSLRTAPPMAQTNSVIH